MGNYEIKLAESGEYIIITVKGEIDSKLATEYIIASHTMGRERGINKYLIEATEARNAETPADNFEFGDSGMDKIPEMDRFARVAMLVDPEDHSHDFIETVMSNRGYAIRLFHEAQSALDYLDVTKG